jgi:osmotically-inducible protein OsmY
MKKINLRLLLWGFAFSVAVQFTACKGGAKDSDIQTSFNQKVQTDAKLSNITASVKDGVVTLSGQCPDEECRMYAEQSAKEIKGVKSVNNNITVTPPSTTTAPVEISPDNALQAGVKDATKDFPGVVATVNNGEITLTGNIERNKLPKLMQNLHALNPKKINNNLTVK